MFDNANIQKYSLKFLIKKLKWEVFEISLYNPEFNQIGQTFEI